ncbi:pumilio-family RNA binding repeat domain containing protein, putative [Babesia ovata]|uniref:Pumilio-family RNA binding repeat domain containing protein, putative n=1 Tax=Babesia ovata TaxID=189622 RepID=A0A2H6KC56_9APIC|nr:pumilio-family RNA binding repeat domain containing protein, putative [Babesia ovata]GBE60564.1 pumilio-family RNA binding repeat domain containing protein, putative [Babesia ovata]
MSNFVEVEKYVRNLRDYFDKRPEESTASEKYLLVYTAFLQIKEHASPLQLRRKLLTELAPHRRKIKSINKKFAGIIQLEAFCKSEFVWIEQQKATESKKKEERKEAADHGNNAECSENQGKKFEVAENQGDNVESEENKDDNVVDGPHARQSTVEKPKESMKPMLCNKKRMKSASLRKPGTAFANSIITIRWTSTVRVSAVHLLSST